MTPPVHPHHVKSIDKEILDLPTWLAAIDNACLANMLIEALYARAQAVKNGALDRRGARGALRSADETVDQIAYGRYRGAAAYTKAADALRKYTQALDTVFPPVNKGRFTSRSARRWVSSLRRRRRHRRDVRGEATAEAVADVTARALT